MLHALDRGDWLADDFFKLATAEVPNYIDIVKTETVFSTQHGVKGEEFGRLLVLYDDIEANWSIRRRQTRTKALGDNRALLLQALSPTLAAGENLNMVAASTPMTTRANALIGLGR